MAPEHGVSPVLDTLLTAVGEGCSTVSTAHEIAKALVVEGNACELVNDFAMCGGGGAFPQNTERDMQRWLKKAEGPSFEHYSVKLKLELSSGKIKETAIACLLSTETMSEMLSHGPATAHISVLGPRGFEGLSEFWNNYKKTPAGQHHLGVKNSTDEELARTVGLFLHEDGGELYRNTEYLWYQVSSAHTAGWSANTIDTKFPMLGM